MARTILNNQQSTPGYLGSASGLSGSSTSATQVSCGAVTVTIPPLASGRRIKVSVCATVNNNTANHSIFPTLWDGAVNTGTNLFQQNVNSAVASSNQTGSYFVVLTPAAGSKTYTLGIGTDGAGTATLANGTILVEVI